METELMGAPPYPPAGLARLRVGAAKWWRLGPYRGTVEAARAAAEAASKAVRRGRLRVRPLRVGAGELDAALGGAAPAAVLRGRVLGAMPVVADFECRLAELDEAERADLLARADDVLEHRFEVLGSGLTELGGVIDWQLDFKTGRRWPVAHISKVPFTFFDYSDIKVPWELSRFHHLPLLAGAWRLTGDPRYLREVGDQLDHWITTNPVEHGANWYSTMDVAIRAANWVATLALCADSAANEPWFGRAIESLLLHGRYIRRYPEYHEFRGNHYLSNLAGILPVAAVFFDGLEGRRWVEWAAGELVLEMEHQVRSDGCDHEASTSYHRLVCEFLVCATQAVDALLPSSFPQWYRERLDLMLQFVADYTRPDGLAPQIGDADNGRFLPLEDYAGPDFRSHLHLFRQARRPYATPTKPAMYPAGGYYVVRGGDLYSIIRCGDTGMYGLGGHAHNDQLSFELMVGGEPLIVDPGPYLYKSDPAARNMFRSTAFHSTLRIGGAEQNEMPPDLVFRMPDRSQSELLRWEPAGERVLFEGRHHGFEVLQPPATHTRQLEFDCAARTVLIRDTVTSSGSHDLEWSFTLAPSRAVARDGGVTAEFERVTLVIEAEGLDFTVEEGWISPSYGVRVRAPFVRARRRGRPGDDVTELALRAES
jgi:hypothetical protein